MGDAGNSKLDLLLTKLDELDPKLVSLKSALEEFVRAEVRDEIAKQMPVQGGEGGNGTD